MRDWPIYSLWYMTEMLIDIMSYIIHICLHELFINTILYMHVFLRFRPRTFAYLWGKGKKREKYV